MQKKTSLVRDIIVVGFALFSMFFGAGNVIFPPYDACRKTVRKNDQKPVVSAQT